MPSAFHGCIYLTFDLVLSHIDHLQKLEEPKGLVLLLLGSAADRIAMDELMQGITYMRSSLNRGTSNVTHRDYYRLYSWRILVCTAHFAKVQPARQQRGFSKHGSMSLSSCPKIV
ncbi:predicted protein [Histoplasma capsulatum var. duboisii H88]|uniref:Predicted protein n=1 Tax=Ajellomyces capsulatus (strain H88) TaxID=544711 RepID=F0UW24_AJEC8|nr:predicted protein [Histoplasma capsulatum var. duboisii H88]